MCIDATSLYADPVIALGKRDALHLQVAHSKIFAEIYSVHHAIFSETSTKLTHRAAQAQANLARFKSQGLPKLTGLRALGEVNFRALYSASLTRGSSLPVMGFSPEEECDAPMLSLEAEMALWEQKLRTSGRIDELSLPELEALILGLDYHSFKAWILAERKMRCADRKDPKVPVENLFFPMVHEKMLLRPSEHSRWPLFIELVLRWNRLDLLAAWFDHQESADLALSTSWDLTSYALLRHLIQAMIECGAELPDAVSEVLLGLVMNQFRSITCMHACEHRFDAWKPNQELSIPILELIREDAQQFFADKQTMHKLSEKVNFNRDGENPELYDAFDELFDKAHNGPIHQKLATEAYVKEFWATSEEAARNEHLNEQSAGLGCWSKNFFKSSTPMKAMFDSQSFVEDFLDAMIRQCLRYGQFERLEGIVQDYQDLLPAHGDYATGWICELIQESPSVADVRKYFHFLAGDPGKLEALSVLKSVLAREDDANLFLMVLDFLGSTPQLLHTHGEGLLASALEWRRPWIFSVIRRLLREQKQVYAERFDAYPEEERAFFVIASEERRRPPLYESIRAGIVRIFPCTVEKIASLYHALCERVMRPGQECVQFYPESFLAKNPMSQDGSLSMGIDLSDEGIEAGILIYPRRHPLSALKMGFENPQRRRTSGIDLDAYPQDPLHLKPEPTADDFIPMKGP